MEPQLLASVLAVALSFLSAVGVIITILVSNKHWHKDLSLQFTNQIGELDGKLSSRIDDLDTKLTTRIDSLEKRLDSRIDGLDGRIDSLEKRLDGRIDGLEKRFDGLEQRVDLLDNRIYDLATTVGSLRNEIHNEKSVAYPSSPNLLVSRSRRGTQAA